MRLVSISIYHHDGRRRDVGFRTSGLNIVTGDSRTGKSSLLNIVDYCLGRDDAPVPRTDWFSVIGWYATVWEFQDGSRAILARPAIRRGSGTTSAMLQFGGPDLVAPQAAELRVNTDSASLRTQVGARIGLGGVRLEGGDESLRGSFGVTIGSAALFSLQEQPEIGSKELLFHRQGEDGIKNALRDTLPFFLGAVAGDQAEKRAALRDAKRALRRVEADLAAREAELEDRGREIRSLYTEAQAVGLVGPRASSSERDLLLALHRVRSEPWGAVNVSTDLDAQDGRRSLRDTQGQLREELSRALTDRDLLLDRQSSAGRYDSSLEVQIGRLESIGLLPEGNDSAGSCPVCGQDLVHDDPTSGQLAQRLRELRAEVQDVSIAQPFVGRAIQRVEERVSQLRHHLNEVTSALESTAVAMVREDGAATAASQEFVRGRIDAIVARFGTQDGDGLEGLRQARDEASALAQAFEAELDDGAVREELTSRLNVLGEYLTDFSRILDLELANNRIRLDVWKLSVVVDTERGPLPLANIGSGENWVGYHVAAHLALHKYFMSVDRPTLRFLMFDQPSQAHFQGEASPNARNADRDRIAVRSMFQLFRDYASEYAERFQLIVIDHATYADEWFQGAVVHDWRGGKRLIPEEWRD